MMSDDEVRQMIADVTADMRPHPPKLKTSPLTIGQRSRRSGKTTRTRPTAIVLRRALR
jgi:hypothetical protein